MTSLHFRRTFPFAMVLLVAGGVSQWNARAADTLDPAQVKSLKPDEIIVGVIAGTAADPLDLRTVASAPDDELVNVLLDPNGDGIDDPAGVHPRDTLNEDGTISPHDAKTGANDGFQTKRAGNDFFRGTIGLGGNGVLEARPAGNDLVIGTIKKGKAPSNPLAIHCYFSLQDYGPTFAHDVFPTFEQRLPVIFRGKMNPRGGFLFADGNDRGEKRKLTLRSKTVDVTSIVTLVGAHHTPPDGKLRYVKPENLPKLRVKYGEATPKKVVFPGSKPFGLTFQVGELKKDELPVGEWNLSLRVNATSLNVILSPASTSAKPDPSFPEIGANGERAAAIFQFRFVVRDYKTKADEQNYLLFRFERAKAHPKLRNDPGKDGALALLDQLIAAYPTDGRMHKQRIELLAEMKDYDKALARLEELEKLVSNDRLKRRFNPGVESLRRLPTRKDMLSWIEDRKIQYQRLRLKEEARKGESKPSLPQAP